MRILLLAALVAVAAASFAAPASAQRGDARTVVCESRDNRSYSCRIGEHRQVQLVRRMSDRRCIEGRNWWVKDDRIVVTGGCRAEFAVYGSGYAYARGRGAYQDGYNDGRDYDRERQDDRYDRYDRDDDRRYDNR